MWTYMSTDYMRESDFEKVHIEIMWDVRLTMQIVKEYNCE